MTEIIGAYGGYRRTLSFGFACLIYHATEVFCERNYSYKNDALGKTVGQMIGAANSVLIAIDQACRLLHRQMESIADTFREEGGFTERMSKARLETRDAQVAAQGAPTCPKCGKPMRKVIARKGRNAGNPFWACTGYPDCNGTRNYTA
jgi:four helix bundle suffix protein